jgi:hypothetical protein
MELTKIPGRVFLDTSALNFILEFDDCIFEGVKPSQSLNERIVADINAFNNIFLTGRRATWQLAVSPFTYKEVIETKDLTKRYYLENWFMEVWNYWLGIIDENNDLPSFIEAEHIRIHLLSSSVLDGLTDIEDRLLICDSIIYKCDCFCTRDWKTILSKRNQLKSLPINIITPTEWWAIIKPYTGLWV